MSNTTGMMGEPDFIETVIDNGGQVPENRDDVEYNTGDPESYQNAISQAIKNAEDFIDTEFETDRELASKYYRAEKFGTEEPGRSQVVMSEVRDTVLSVMPGLLRVFCGTAPAVEFQPNYGVDAEKAKAMTAYVNHIIENDNAGFTIFHSAFKDALVRKTGIFTWWHEEREENVRQVYTGLSDDAFTALSMDMEAKSASGNVEDYEIEVTDVSRSGNVDPNTGAPAVFRDAVVTETRIKARHRVAAVPPEEFILSPEVSDNLDDYAVVGRREVKTIGELVALGHDEDEIREAIGGQGQHNSYTPWRDDNQRTRGLADDLYDSGFSAVDPSSEEVKYVTVYVKIDGDEDGIQERRKIVTVGENHRIIFDEVVSGMVPFSIICPDPEPHSPFGYSLADQTMDLQEVKSEMMRGVLDSLAESIRGRMGLIEGQANIDDALSSDRDQIIRMKRPDALFPLSKNFQGANALPLFEYIDNVKARRTGQTMSPNGLSPDALQSTSTDAVNAVVDASQDRSEMIARIFAETGIKRMMKGLLAQVVHHQDQPRMIRISGRSVKVDPRQFVTSAEMTANVGLGRGNSDKRIQGLQMVLSQQKEVFAQYGMNNPVIGLDHISNTMEDLVNELGFSDASRYMNMISSEQAEQMRQAEANKPKEPTPDEMAHERELRKINMDHAAKMAREMTDRLRLSVDDDFNRDELEQKLYVEAAKILGEFGVKLDEQDIQKRMSADRTSETAAPQQTVNHNNNGS